MAFGASGPDSPRKPKAKRPRVEDPSGPGVRLIKTSRGELWFDDGNIVIAAGGTAFRVYKGILAKSSPVLADVLSEPQPEKCEGCDVLHLRGDDPVDVARVLELIFCSPDLYYDGKPVRFSVVASWIRMADKYKMHRILDHALARLRSFFSDDASQWRDALRNHASRSIKVNAEDAIAAVKLARLTGTFSLLPTALYTCSQLSSPTLLFGVFRDDTSGTVEKLAEDDIVRCLDAREALTRLNLLSTFQVWNPRVSHMCMDTVNCLATFEHQTRAIREGSVVHQYTLSATMREVIGDVCLCVACEEMLRKRLERAQRRHWAELPHMFDLGLHISGWDDRVGGTVAATDNDSYAGDELDNAPEEAERTDFGEATQDGGLQDADKTVPEGALDEEQTDADTYTTVDIGEESKDEDSDVPGSDDERAHFRVYTSDEEEQAVASQTSDDESPFRAEFRTP